MTYEERIAAAQAKMDAFKAKMAASSEKAKAAHAMKKEEISAAIDSINADLDELDASLAEDYAKYNAAVEEFDKAVAEDYAKLDAAMAERAEAKVADDVATIDGNINAAKENVRLAKERADSKIYAFKLKAQMKAEAIKDKLAAKRAERDKAAMELYIMDLLDYAESCQQVAFAAAIEADLTLLQAAEVATEYVEKYGEPEAPAEESAE